jgi:uncharacterized protein (TIGR02594 family)
MAPTGIRPDFVYGDVLSRCPWMVSALRYAGSHMQVKVVDKKQSASPMDESTLKHFLNLTHSPLYESRDHITFTSWCSAFVNACMTEVGIRGTNSPSARSWEQWGHPTDHPRFGDVVILGREHNRNRKDYGHVAFFLKFAHPNVIALLGGNQLNKVMVREYPLGAQESGDHWLIGYRRYPFLS